jgi:hypothetical protein
MFVDSYEWDMSVVEEHFEELQALWYVHASAIRNDRYWAGDLLKLQQRIAAHGDGVVLAGSRAHSVIHEALFSGDAGLAFAAVVTSLRAPELPLLQLLFKAFDQAAEAAAQGFIEGFCASSISACQSMLQERLDVPEANIASQAAYILAFHGRLPVDHPCNSAFLCDASAIIRERGWKTMPLLFAVHASPVVAPVAAVRPTSSSAGMLNSPYPFAAALSDDVPSVRQAALEAAAWMRQPWLLDYCRQQAQQPAPEQIDCYAMFAILAGPADLPHIHAIGSAPSLGARRLEIVGKFGHPALLPLLLEHFENEDQRTAVAAGKAFEKISGFSAESDTRVTLPPEDGSQPDEFEAEFLDEEKLPDRARAKQFLAEHAERLQSSPRWSRGVDIRGPITRDQFMGLDLEARWEAALRGVYRNELHLSPAQLLRQRPLTAAIR